MSGPCLLCELLCQGQILRPIQRGDLNILALLLRLPSCNGPLEFLPQLDIQLPLHEIFLRIREMVPLFVWITEWWQSSISQLLVKYQDGAGKLVQVHQVLRRNPPLISELNPDLRINALFYSDSSSLGKKLWVAFCLSCFSFSHSSSQCFQLLP